MCAVRPRILCVDDEPVNLRLLEAMLVPRGYEIIKATNVKAAMDTLAVGGVDLVLMDVMMPEVSGLQACKNIKDDPRMKGVPIVMVTSLNGEEAMNMCFNAGAEGFLSKPLEKDAVLQTINSYVKIAG